METSSSPITNQNAVISIREPLNSCQEQELSNSEQEVSSDEQLLHESRLGNVLENSCHGTEDIVNTNMHHSATDMNLHAVLMGQQNETAYNIVTTSDAIITQPNRSNAITAVPSAIAEVSGNANETLSNENKVKASLAKELLNLSKYGWYWGPISGDEADAKLISEPDGAFLVRDSSDDRCKH
jgi:hypothetical protein